MKKKSQSKLLNVLIVCFILVGVLSMYVIANDAFGALIFGDNESGWLLTTETGGKEYVFIMNRGDLQTKSLVFRNLGKTIRPIFIRCENKVTNFCDYLTLSDVFIELPIPTDIETLVDFTLDLPEEMEKGDYIFNIIAEDDFNRTAVLPITIKVETVSIISELNAKRFMSTKIFGLNIPYMLLFFMVWVVSSIILFYVVFDRITLKGGKIWSLFIGLFLSLIFVIFA